MKIADLIKQLSALKKIHGSVDVMLVNGDTGNLEHARTISTAHPFDKNQCYDKVKPAYAIIINTW